VCFLNLAVSVATEARQRSVNAKSEARARPKPYSIERRFWLMQAATFAFTLLLLAGVLYQNWSFQESLTSTLDDLHLALLLGANIRYAHENTAQAFWHLYDGGEQEYASKYKQGVHNLDAQLRQYDALQLSRDERVDSDRVRNLENAFIGQTGKMLLSAQHSKRDPADHLEAERLGAETELALGRLEQLESQRLESLDTQARRSSFRFALLILFFAGWALLALVHIRRTYRNHLWAHLDRLRQMVGEIRRGNLNIAAVVPDSIELGSLMGAFLNMAAELREMRDSLEQKVLERTTKLETTQNELIQSAKLASLGQLVSGVAHEINNPLTSILGFSEILLGNLEVDSPARNRVRTIRDEALRLKNLVANLNSFARRAPHRTQRFDLSTILTRLGELRNYQLHVDNISLHLSKPTCPVWVVADPDQILQVVLNLVLNAEQAIKERRSTGDIWLACGLDHGNAWLSVKDNGGGMSHEVREHIFEPFFTTKPAGNGTGLGLSISHGIIHQHKGTIAAESTPGQGTTIRIVLPYAREDATKERLSACMGNENKVRQTAGLHAMVIDDEASILEMVGEALGEMNCRTTLLNDSSDVEDALDGKEFDFVMCDLKMPRRNGLEIYRLIRRKRPKLAERFVLMTGNFADAGPQMPELASVPILLKPFSLKSLREALAQVLQNGRVPVE